MDDCFSYSLYIFHQNHLNLRPRDCGVNEGAIQHSCLTGTIAHLPTQRASEILQLIPHKWQLV